MDAVLLIAGLFVLWIWLHGHPIGALVVFVALFVVLGADAHPDSPFMTIHNEVITLGYLAAFALAPMTILSIYRDLKKGRGSRLAYFGDMALTSLTAPPVPQAQKPEDRCWTKEVIQAYFDN